MSEPIPAPDPFEMPGMPQFPDPIDPDAPGRGPLIMGVTWTMTILCILIISARFYVRATVARKVSSDDWFMLAAVVMQITFQGCITEASRWGLGKRDANLSVFPQLIQVLKWNWISTTPSIMVSILARVSANILLTRLFGTKPWLRWFLWIFTGLQVVVSSVLIVLVWVQVDPVEGLWNPFMAVNRRWDPRIQQNTSYLAQSLFTFSDVTYVLFPVMVIWKLHMPLRRKIGLGLLMGLSLITAGASIMKTITTPRADTGNTQDAQYNASLAVLWSGIEQSLVIIMGSIPPLRAKFKALMVERFGWFGTTVVGFVSADRTRNSTHHTHKQQRGSKRFSGGSQQSLRRGLHTGDCMWDSSGSGGHRHAPQLSSSSGSSGGETPPMDLSTAEMGQIRRTDEVTITFTDHPRTKS
ncbi:hypothetical protein SODALDRAFT_331707 [Sodiomyces alkalinus F11]|uniref:Rhodopsin domain-containing protein n=1 Tax=Sodiomyces alkalinus (strain CBS 110278 / VKM F-3762 / F11) TaxID=1314773 RepID=A0A3N2PYN1_SODAK|nr:hypothetical protein SODALDRAFT_331707 [Sodiomyces alkalinus F11]ROT39594.1 hypothetical protein SODALDRAFT_331707 [Sodiomyces alkalinus F11]